MRDCIFKNFVIDVCNEHNKANRVFTKEVVGQTWQYKNFFGVIYNAISNHSFDDITDIKGYMETMNPDMLLLHSRITDQEVEIYSWKLKDYSIEGDKLIINLDNKTVKFIM
jgi:hypothetical protein